MENENRMNPAPEEAVEAAEPAVENMTEEAATAPEAPTTVLEKRCPNCQTLLGEKQMFCHECGASYKKVCTNCKAELSDGQTFCTVCGHRIGNETSEPINESILQFNAELGKAKKKKKKWPIIAAICSVLAIIAVIVSVNVIREKKTEEYIQSAEQFSKVVLESGTEIETVGNAIQTAWGKYVNSIYGAYYNGKYLSSVDDAVDAAQAEQSKRISEAKSAKSKIDSLYKKLKTVPDKNNDKLNDIKDAVEDVYEAYEEMYDVIINVSGNYNTYKSAFGRVDKNLADTIDKLDKVLD